MKTIIIFLGLFSITSFAKIHCTLKAHQVQNNNGIEVETKSPHFHENFTLDERRNYENTRGSENSPIPGKYASYTVTLLKKIDEVAVDIRALPLRAGRGMNNTHISIGIAQSSLNNLYDNENRTDTIEVTFPDVSKTKYSVSLYCYRK